LDVGIYLNPFYLDADHTWKIYLDASKSCCSIINTLC
jgi:hypothetical protein